MGSDGETTAEAEVRALSDAYEAALLVDDVAAMDAAFWDDPDALRFGIAEIQRGHAAIAEWRRTAGGVPPGRRITSREVCELAPGVVAVDLTFVNGDDPTVGRQSQTWVRHRAGGASPAPTSPCNVEHGALPRSPGLIVRHPVVTGCIQSCTHRRNNRSLTSGPMAIRRGSVRSGTNPSRATSVVRPDVREPVAPAGSRGDQAYRVLKTKLLMGELPLNTRLGEEKLAGIVGVSRTPVREALKRLAAEGLVGLHPEGGYQPVVPDVTVMRHLYEVRAGLELQALQRPARLGTRHDPAILEPLRDQWRTLATGDLPPPDPNFVLLDESFHIALATAAANEVAVDLLRQINERIRLVRMHDFLIKQRIDATIHEHLNLVELVLAGDIVNAEAAFTQHLGDSMAVVEERVRVAIVRMLTGGTI